MENAPIYRADCLLQYVVAFLIFLRLLKRLNILPTEPRVARIAIYVSYDMEACQQQPILCWPGAHVDHVSEEVRSAMASLEGLGNYGVVRC